MKAPPGSTGRGFFHIHITIFAEISHGLRQRRFASDPDVVGTFVHLDSRGYEIIGVLAEGLECPEHAQVWSPLPPSAQMDDDREVHIVARLRSDAHMSIASAEVQSVRPSR